MTNLAGTSWLVAAVLSLGIALRSPPAQATGTKTFSGQRALRHVAELVKLPRHYEAAGRQRAIDYIAAAVRPHVSQIVFQRLEGRDRRSGKRYPLVNIVARQNPSARKRIVIGSHWDSRLWAEQDPDLGRRDQPIVGANDGGSGVAVLLELAGHTAGLSGFGIDYVFFDGEEMGRPGDNGGYCQGSGFLAENLKRLYRREAPRAVIVLDMVGDRDLNLHHEVSSLSSAPALVGALWGQAEALGAKGWFPSARHHIIDDHTPFQKLRIPAILVIDYDYPHWHTHGDTLDKVTADSLESVGAVMLSFLVSRQRAGLDFAPPPRPGRP